MINRVEQEALALAPTVRQALEKSDPAKWITLLIAIITLYLQATAAQPPSADEVAEAIRKKPVPTHAVPSPAAKAAIPKAKAKRKRAPKSHGTAKQRKSRKRR